MSTADGAVQFELPRSLMTLQYVPISNTIFGEDLYMTQSSNTDTSRMSRLELLSLVVDAARSIAELLGKEEKVDGVSGPVKIFDQAPLMILYRSPRSLITTAHGNFGIDIWYENKKVFSATWNSNMLKDYELITLKRGPWIPALVSISRKAK